jgi:hypothetical protein
MRPACFSPLCAVVLGLCGCGKPDVHLVRDGAVSWEQLLADAAELKPAVTGRPRLFSSAAGAAGRVLTGESPQIYGDLDHGSFLNVQEVQGGYEATLAEMHGPGAVTWMWSANPVGQLVLEVDGREMRYPFRSFLSGDWLPVASPFAGQTAGGFNLHFPILHRTHCRIAVRARSRSELGALFYQVAWNALGTDVEITPFQPDRIGKEKAKLKLLARMLRHPSGQPLKTTFDGPVDPGTSADVLSLSGSGTIECLELVASSREQLAQLHIEAVWDQAEPPAVSCPLHMLCGVSTRFENVNALPAEVNGTTATLRWPLPFSRGARIRLSNRGPTKVRLRVGASVDRTTSSAHRFHARLSSHRHLQTDEPNLLTLLDAAGPGALAGCVLQVDHRSGGWWGEGDPLIWLDEEDVPAWRSTGTEDYFGFAWCSTKKFQHPFRGQTRAGPSYAAMYRYHVLDALPFRERVRFDFEAHGTAAGSMDYSALVLWYSCTSSMNAWNVLK